MPEMPQDYNAGATSGASGEVVRLTVVSTVVIILFAGGVYWLRNMPTLSPGSEAGTTIQVRLLPTPEATPIPVPDADPFQSESVDDGKGDRPSPDPSDEANEEISPSPSITVATLRPPSSPAVRMNPTSPRRAAPELAFRFQQTLRRHISRFQHYPARARERQLEGAVRVKFLLRRDGTIADAWIDSSSGQIILDEEALATLRRAEPLPIIPIELPDQLRVLLPIEFAP